MSNWGANMRAHEFRKVDGQWQRREIGSRTWKSLRVIRHPIPSTRRPGGHSNPIVPHTEYRHEWRWE
jgi:hypothetical protein